MPIQEHCVTCISNLVWTQRSLTQQKGELLAQRRAGFCNGVFLLLLFIGNLNKAASHLQIFISQDLDLCVDVHCTLTNLIILQVSCWCEGLYRLYRAVLDNAYVFIDSFLSCSLYLTCCLPFSFHYLSWILSFFPLSHCHVHSPGCFLLCLPTWPEPVRKWGNGPFLLHAVRHTCPWL